MLLRAAPSLRPTTRPQRSDSLSGTVLVIDAEGRGTCSVRFDPGEVARIGKASPLGLGPANPGYLKLIAMPTSYDIWLHYFDMPQAFLLWSQPEKPLWCTQVKRHTA